MGHIIWFQSARHGEFLNFSSDFTSTSQSIHLSETEVSQFLPVKTFRLEVLVVEKVSCSSRMNSLDLTNENPTDKIPSNTHMYKFSERSIWI